MPSEELTKESKLSTSDLVIQSMAQKIESCDTLPLTALINQFCTYDQGPPIGYIFSKQQKIDYDFYEGTEHVVDSPYDLNQERVPLERISSEIFHNLLVHLGLHFDMLPLSSRSMIEKQSSYTGIELLNSFYHGFETLLLYYDLGTAMRKLQQIGENKDSILKQLLPLVFSGQKLEESQSLLNSYYTGAIGEIGAALILPTLFKGIGRAKVAKASIAEDMQGIDYKVNLIGENMSVPIQVKTTVDIATKRNADKGLSYVETFGIVPLQINLCPRRGMILPRIRTRLDTNRIFSQNILHAICREFDFSFEIYRRAIIKGMSIRKSINEIQLIEVPS